MKKNKKIPNTPKYKFGGKTIFTPDKDDKQKMKKFGKQAGTAAYGIGEGLLDTVTMGATDQLTDQGYSALQRAGNSTQDEMREQDSIRGFSNAAGAIGGAIINPGATGTAISQTGKGLGAGVSKGNESKDWAQTAGMALNTAGQIGAMAYGQAGSPMSSGMQTQAGNFNASGFGQGLDKYNQYMNQGNMNSQMGGMLNSFMPNLPSGTPPLAMKYGGQMKYAMGGMQYANGGTGEMNAEVEGGGYNEDGENAIAPGGQFTQFNGPTHAQGGIQTDMAPGTRIFSDKLKVPGTNKSFAKLNKVNDTAKLEKKFAKLPQNTYTNNSKNIQEMGMLKNSDVLFNMQEQLKKDKVAAYAKKMGVQLPSMDNEQMEPQDMSEQSEGEYKYGGIHIKESKKGTFTAAATKHGKSVQAFASQVLANKENYSPAMVKKANFAHNAAGWKHAMGGVQLPYYNTDNAGNPIYAMGGGYPAMTNPYNNFRGSIPMYPDGGLTLGDEPKGAVKVAAVGSNYKPLGSFGNKEYFDKESDKAISGNSGAGSDWENSIIKRLQSGVSIEELVKGGHGTSEGLAKYAPYYKPVYIEKFDNNTTTPSGKYDQRIDRKQVYNTTTNNPYIKYFDYPDANAGYSKATRVAVDAKTGKPVDPIKSFDAKGNYVPSFTIDTGRDYYENTIKSSVPGTNPTNLRLQNTGNLRREAIQTGGFKYGGQMPKYEDGAITPFNFKPANQSYQFGRARFLSNGQLDQTDPLARVKMNIDNNTEKPYIGNSNYISPEDEYNRDLAVANARATQEVPGANKPNWMDIVGKGVNFAAQNIGNIYDLSRKDAPLQSYERATGKYLDPTQARRDEQYAYRQANKAIPGLVGGSAGAAMNLLGANKARTSTNIGRINKEYENANAQIGNQLNQYNTEIAYREAEARAKDAAMKENIRSQALHGVGTAFGKATKSGKEDVMDQKTLEMYKQYYNNPQFRAALKKAGYDV